LVQIDLALSAMLVLSTDIKKELKKKKKKKKKKKSAGKKIKSHFLKKKNVAPLKSRHQGEGV
jgi:hypothetical protein